MRFTYSVHGLSLHSELEFPELAFGSSPPDVRVRRGAVPEHLDAVAAKGVLFEASPENYLLRVAGAARYWVRSGCEVIIDPEPDAPAAYVRMLFLGSVLTAVLHQRGVLAIHAAGVAGPRGAVLFAGHSGSGKSTLLAALVGHGHQVVTDDAAAVTLDAGGQPIVHPGSAEVRLWRNATAYLGHDCSQLTRPHPDIEKYALRLTSQFSAVARPLAAIVLLGVHNADDVLIERVPDCQCFDAVRAYTRNRLVLDGLGMHVPHFRLATAVASRVPLFRLTRPLGRDSLGELVARVEPLLH